jgi:hypothetical protein
MDKMDGWHTYWMLLNNNFNNNLNIAVSGEIYPELAGMNFSEKLVELWGEWYLNPKSRYSYIKRFNKLLPKCLPEEKVTDSKAVAEGNMEMRRFSNPREVMADRLWEIVSSFANTNKKAESHHIVAKERKDILARINADF